MEDKLAFPNGVRREIIRTMASDTMHGFGTIETSIHHRLATNNPVRVGRACACSSLRLSAQRRLIHGRCHIAIGLLARHDLPTCLG